jgi:Protein of unknown function (DUF4199)
MRYALVYGGIAGAVVIIVICLSLATGLPTHAHSELFGYLVMLAALSLIFVGVKRYRDVECGGVIRFGRAFALGLGIAAVAGVIYVIGWEIFLAASGRDFIAEYSTSILDGMRADGATPAAIQAKGAEMREMAVMYRNPLFRMPMTFAEIFPVGLLVALVSAALLRNPRLLPAPR